MNFKQLSRSLKRFSITVLSALMFMFVGHANANNTITDLLGTALACQLVKETALADMDVQPLYRVVDGQCIASEPGSGATSWYSDNQCSVSVSFASQSMGDYCAQASDRARLGNAENIAENTWSLSPGNRINLGARTLKNLTQPYVQRVAYRQVNTARGTCELEMRIYKRHPASVGEKTLIAFHGGSWSSRSFGFLGLELSVPHFVNEGYVVYAPFYRLLDNTDSNAACNQADFDDIVSDADAALDWVLDNANSYGSQGVPVLFGQSAGAHLSLSLAVNRPTAVSGAMLFYPPTDFTDFLQRVQSGAYTNPQGLSILERVMGVSFDQASASDPLVSANSFPARIRDEASEWPPLFIVHGGADELVESRQSVRLCDALAGREILPAGQEAAAISGLKQIVNCTSDVSPVSQLHLIAQGEHALDVCINSLLSDACPSGGEASKALVGETIGEALMFSDAAVEARSSANAGNTDGNSDNNSNSNEDSNGSNSAAVVKSGGGSTGLALLFILLALNAVSFVHRKIARTVHPAK